MAAAHLSVFLRRLTRGIATEALAHQSDRQLVEQILTRRDGSALEALVCRHGPMVSRVCWRVLQQEQDAEDAFQATFLVLAQKLHTVRKHDSLASWLHGVAHRLSLKAKAQGTLRRCHEQQRGVSELVQQSDEVAWGEVWTVLDAELAQLPDRWRLPLILCYLEARTQDEAAGHLGCSRTTLQRRLDEARAALGRRLTRRGIAGPTALSAVLLSDCVTAAKLPPGLFGSTVEAAACVAAGQAAKAVVSAKVAALTEGVIRSMLPGKLKIATALFALTSLLIAGVSVGLGEGQQPKTAQPSRPAPEAKEEPKAKEKEDAPWKKEFRKVYGLADGEVLKRVKPPFPDCRTEFLKSEPNLVQFLVLPPNLMTFRVPPKGTDPLMGPKGEYPLWGMGQFEATVHIALRMAAGIRDAEIEAEQGLLAKVVGGDFVYRDGASVEKRISALDRILRDECKLPVKLTLRQVEREVIVVSGKPKVQPLKGQPKGHVAVYAKELTKEEDDAFRICAARGGRLQDFFDDLEGFVGRRIVNETTSGKGEWIGFSFHTRQSKQPNKMLVPIDTPAVDPGIAAEDRDPKLVLPNVATQTGLKLTFEKRKVRVLFVTKSDK